MEAIKSIGFIKIHAFASFWKDRTSMPKGMPKVIFLIQNFDMGLPGSTYPLIFDVLVRCQKPSAFFWSAKNRLQIFKSRSLQQPRVARGTSTHRCGESVVPGRLPLIKERNWWIDDKHDEVQGLTRRWAVGPANYFISVSLNLTHFMWFFSTHSPKYLTRFEYVKLESKQHHFNMFSEFRSAV